MNFFRLFMAWHNRLEIHARIGVLVIACVIPVWLFGLYTSMAAYHRDRHALEETLLTAARMQTALLERKLASAEAALQALSLSPSLDTGDLVAFRTQAQAVSDYSSALNIVLLNDAGAQIVNTLTAPGAALPTQPPPFFATVMATAKPVQSDLFVGPVSHRPLVALTVPVFRQGRIAYILAMSLDASQLGNLLTQAQFPPSWVVAILDKGGTIVARSQQAEKFVGQKSVQPVLDARARQQLGVLEAQTLEGIHTLAAYSSSELSDWTVVVGVPRDLFISDLRWSLAYSMALAVAVLLAALFLARWMGNRISDPVRALVPLATALGRNEIVTETSLGLREADDVGAALAQASLLIHKRTKERDESYHRESGLLEANTELEQFAYAASHDLREPLRMVSSYIALLGRRYADRLDAEGREFLEFARDGAQRMDGMVLDLLELSRVGRSGDPFAPISLTDVVAVAVENLALTITENAAHITIAPDLPVVTGSRSELVRLVQNIIGNALKYRHGERPPVLNVAVNKAEREWVLSIADNGIGIAPEYFDRIFKIFQRLHTRKDYEGSGIGLAICKKIVEHHGGRIWLESVPDSGTTFFIALRPAAAAAV